MPTSGIIPTRIEAKGRAMLIRRIERFLRATGMPWTKFGRLAVNDPRFVADLRNGRLPRVSLERRVEHFMNNYDQEQPDAI